MRAVIVLFMVLAMAGIGMHGCASYVGGSAGTGSVERVIDAEPGEIVEAMNRSLRADGMEVVSRSDSGDHYRQSMSAAEMRSHPKFARLADQGGLTFNARVSRSEMVFTADFDSGLVAGFTMHLSPAPDGRGTLARVEPLIRDGGRENDPAVIASLRRNWSRYGENALDTVAEAAESDSPTPVL